MVGKVMVSVMPNQPSPCTRKCSRASTGSVVPEPQKRNWCRSGTGCAARVFIMKGELQVQVQPWRRALAQNRLPEYRGRTTMDPPPHIVPSDEYMRALVWNSGKKTRPT